jgi:uncharacterized protein YkwD
MRAGGGIIRIFLCVLLALSAAGCAGLFGPSRPDFSKQMPALEARILTLVEQERLKANPQARPLMLDSELVAVARKRSAGMAQARSFSAADPHASATMLMQQDTKFQGLVGENVAAQYYNPQIGIDVDAFARRFVDGWIASKPHQDNLSFTDYDHTGIGAAVNEDTVYVTQLFTTDLGLTQQQTPEPLVAPVSSPQEGKDQAQPVPLRGAIVPGVPAQ